MAPFRGAKVVVNHNQWQYFLSRFGLVLAGTVEERPGIPPSPAHLARLIGQMKAAAVKALVLEPWGDRKVAGYAVSAAAAVLLVDRAPHGAEHLRGMLVGSLLAVRGAEVAQIAALYAAVGLFHWLCRRPFFLISTDPDAAFRAGWRVRPWDFLFYASFGLVVTSSVRIAGVLLVFSYLIVPALAGDRARGLHQPRASGSAGPSARP